MVKSLLRKMSFPVVYLLNRQVFMWFNKLLYLFSLRLLGIGLSYAGKANSSLSLNEEKWLASIRDKIVNGVVLDVGANVGQYANAVRNYCPSARVICFEPHPLAFKKLAENVLHKDIEIYNVALSDRAGSATLFERKDMDLSTVASLEKRTLELFGGYGKTYEVQVTTLDQFCKENQIVDVALLKVDAEGFDLHVLKGAAKLLKTGSIKVIEFEYIPACIHTKVNIKDFFDVLQGYNIYRLALNGSLLPLFPYDYRFSEIYAGQYLIAVKQT